MRYEKTKSGRFIERLNRFTALVDTDEGRVLCHVKNTGRCAELFVHGADVTIMRADRPTRKTAYDLITVKKGSMLVNVDSMAPNRVIEEAIREDKLFGPIGTLKPEYTYGSSRFDFFLTSLGRPHMVEVKGVTLERNGIALFPDAPTERGVKHLNGLIECIQSGMEAAAIFVIQLKGVSSFSPNDIQDSAFGEALRVAAFAGVSIMAFDCLVTANSIELGEPIPVIL